MSTPSIQTLITQAQQVLNLKSSNEIRATLAAVLANANVGTPLNPNLTTQQLWDEFYEIVRQPSDDIMSIITDQMMRMMYAPPAPGGAGADKQVIFNDGGVLEGDSKFLWDKNANRLDVDGPVVITGAATVGTTLGVTGATTLTGNVGIGVAPGLGLDIYKPCLTGFTNLPANVAVSDSTAMAAGVGGGIFFQGRYDGTTNVTAFGIISGVKENGTASNFAGALVFGTRDAGGGTAIERLRINSTGNIVMKNANTGIDFSATSEGSGTMTSELLNDYEEGTWTIGLTFGGGNTGLTTSSNAGRYTKVGRQVTVNGYIELTNKGSSTGSATITGLPFTIAAPNASYPAASLRFNGISYVGAFQGFGAVNTTLLGLEQLSTLGAVSSLTDANFVNTSSVIFTLTYTV